jgi:guanine nucleotide-binding protein G(i) subunit alpha
MADPITIIGTVGAVANIVEVIGKIVGCLRDIHDRWKNADFTILNLIAQLAALKAALRKIQEWIDSDLAEQHHQLIMDLELSLTCCRTIIGAMDTEVTAIHLTANDTLDFGSRIKIAFGGKADQDLQMMIERQISALTLLLTACNW